AAIRRADALSRSEINAGAIAFSRSGSPEFGDFDDAVVLKSFGDVPYDFACGAGEPREWPCQVAIPAAFFARTCGVRRGDEGANAASCARRSILSWAVFVRSIRARCSYSGNEPWPPKSDSCLKRRSASSLGVIKTSSFVLIASPDVRFLAPAIW